MSNNTKNEFLETILAAQDLNKSIMEDLQALNNGLDVVNAENIMDTVEELADLLMWLESAYSADSQKGEERHNGKR